jgi:Flp pilus assembly protein TadG
MSSRAGCSSSPATGRRPARRGERGSAAVEFAIAAPMLVLIVALLWQGWVWAMGDYAARSAANHALQTTRVVGGTDAAGRDDAAALLQQNGGGFLDGTTITVTRTPTVTIVTIRGRAHSILPASLLSGVQPVITVTVQGPTERPT